MLTSEQMVTLTPDVRAYLEAEAARRGVDVATVYEEEVAAQAELAKITPTNAKLKELATKNPPSPEWFAREEDDLF